MKVSILLSLILTAPAFAASAPHRSIVRLSAGSKSENKLRRFVSQDALLKARLDEAARREEFYIAEARESDLRDAVSDIHSGDQLRSGLAKTAGEKQKDLLETLPGIKAFGTATVCHTIATCPTPDLALDVADAEHLPDSVRRLVRPWMVLQQARGSVVELASIDGTGDAALSLKLEDLDASPLIINISPRLLGGFKVWFERPLVLAALYGREREAVLSAVR